MNIQAAIKKAEIDIHNFLELDELTTTRIYTWQHDEDYKDFDDSFRRDIATGLRVAEVSFTEKGSGSTYMQVDLPHGLLVCAATERYILALVEEWPEDEILDEWWRLMVALTDFETADKKIEELRVK